jgi:hypothetical protein
VAGLRPGFGLFWDMRLWFPRVVGVVSIDGVNLRSTNCTRLRHYTRIARNGLIAVLACALSGCWEEIYYTAPTPTATPTTASSPADSTPATEVSADPLAASTPDESPPSEAGDFGDDLAEELAVTDGSGATADLLAVEEPTMTAGETRLPPADATAMGGSTVESEVPADPAADSTATTDASRSPRRIAWLLGSNLSLAALANDRAAPPEKVADWYDKAERLAKLLGTEVAVLPPRPTDEEADPKSERAIAYLFDQGQQLGRFAAQQFGDDHAALVELAVKSNILLVLYQPGAPVVKTLTVAIEQSGERARVPAETWQPLVQLLDAGATPKEVRDAIFGFHESVDQYLSTEAQ